MSPSESRLLTFVASRLESLLRRPAAWGSMLSVEEQVLQLLELRRVLLDPSLTANDTRKLMQTYARFIARTLEDATPEPLAIQLERLGRVAELPALLGEFIELELAEFVADVDQNADEIERTDHVEGIQRLIEQLRAGVETDLQRRHLHNAINFSDVKRN
jgi:hypothetical protein